MADLRSEAAFQKLKHREGENVLDSRVHSFTGATRPNLTDDRRESWEMVKEP